MTSISQLAARLIALVVGGVLTVECAAQDWPQWRGPNRDAHATGFQAPEAWPAELQKAWSVEVGDGVSTPSIVGDRLYVFARQGDSEVLSCLNAKTGQEIWKKGYQADEVTGGAARFPVHGPRSSPTVAQGKVVTFGVRSAVHCYDAESGELVWEKPSVEGSWPTFFTSFSPIVVDGACVVFTGSDDEGALVAFELDSGDERWKLPGKSPSYGSPVIMNVDGVNAIVTPGDRTLLAVNAADGRLLWEMPFEQGRYNAGTPIVDGQTLIVAGPGTGLTAFNLAKEGDQLIAEEKWRNPDNSVQFNTPVIYERLLFGIANNGQLFCIDLESGATKWTSPMAEQTAIVPRQTVFAQQRDDDDRRRGRGFGGRGGGRGRGARRGGGGYGSVVSAGSVLMALAPETQLVVFKPSADGFEKLASYKVGETGTYAYPIPTANGIYVKDQNSVALWTLN